MKDWTGSSIQREALTVGCRYCQARPGETCIGYDRKPLEAFPAHTCRTADARAAAAKETA